MAKMSEQFRFLVVARVVTGLKVQFVTSQRCNSHTQHVHLLTVGKHGLLSWSIIQLKPRNKAFAQFAIHISCLTLVD